MSDVHVNYYKSGNLSPCSKNCLQHRDINVVKLQNDTTSRCKNDSILR